MINLYQIVNADPISLVFPQCKAVALMAQNSVHMYGMVVNRGSRLQLPQLVNSLNSVNFTQAVMHELGSI